MTPLLLDTCAVIWLGGGAAIAADAAKALSQSASADSPSFVCPITAWELGILISRGRLPSTIRERVLLERVMSVPGMQYAELSASVLIDSSYLPGIPPADPADRIIIATAREYGLRIVTRDRKILDYADKGHVLALAC